MKLHSAPGTCGTAVHVMLEWIGLTHEVEHLDLACEISPTYHPNVSQSSRSMSPNVATRFHHGSHPERSDAIRLCSASGSPLLFQV